MIVEVRYFASLSDLAGLSAERVELDAGADVGGLWALLCERHAGLRDLSYRPMVACDMVYAGWDRGLEGVREVAFLPPVSGG